MTAPRIVARGATYAATRRTVCRKAFLGWWHPEVDTVFFWCLAYAAAKCGVAIHHAVRVGSHYHLTFTITRENLGEFLRLLNHQLSCCLNTLLIRERYDAPRELFDARGTHVMRLMDAEAQLAHIVYERLNPPAAGLSETCDGVPGRTLPPGLWKGAAIQLTRPKVYVQGGRAKRTLRLSPPPLLYRAFGGDIHGLVHHIGKLEREGERAIRAARTRPAKTAAEVRAIHAWDEPMTLREAGGGRVPTFKTGLTGEVGRTAWIQGAEEVTAFRRAHHAANQKWCAGHREVEYPHGTYEMRRFHGAKVAEPWDDAWVSAPGPTLAEVKAELAEGGGERDEGLVDRVREAMLEAIPEVVVRDEPAPTDHDQDEPPSSEDDDQRLQPPRQRGEPETFHRFAKLRPRDPEEQPRRLIRLRDKRRGRGNDPPDD